MSLARVGFTVNGRDVTPDQPCMFDQYCNVQDFENWLTHARQWMFAVLNRAKTGPQLIAMRPMVKRLASIEGRGRKGIIERLRLTGPTKDLVGMAVDLENIARTLGPPVSNQEVTRDLSRPVVQLPVPDEVGEQLGWDWSIDKFVADVTKMATSTVDKAEDFVRGRYLTWALLSGVLLWALSEAKK